MADIITKDSDQGNPGIAAGAADRKRAACESRTADKKGRID